MFSGDNPGGTNTTVYYLPGTTNWGLRFVGLPALLWNPQVQTGGADFGVWTNQFGFTITGNSNLNIVVEACADLSNPLWSPAGTNTLAGGSSYFSDPLWTNYPCRFLPPPPALSRERVKPGSPGCRALSCSRRAQARHP